MIVQYRAEYNRRNRRWEIHWRLRLLGVPLYRDLSPRAHRGAPVRPPGYAVDSMIVPAAISSMLCLSLLTAWIERKAVVLALGERMPLFRFALWGHVVREGGKSSPFLLVKLPSWEWGYDLLTGENDWHQFVVLWQPGRSLQWGYSFPCRERS